MDSADDDGESNESAAALLYVTTLLRQHKESEARAKPTIPGLEDVLPMFWLTLARAAVAVGMQPGNDALLARSTLELARSYVHKALHVGWCDAEALHMAGQIVTEIGAADLPDATGDEDYDGYDIPAPQKLFEEACSYLENAVKLAPARPDILASYSRALSEQAPWLEKPKSRTLLLEAIRRSDEAADCFGETNRLLPNGDLHPTYVVSLLSGSAARLIVATVADESLGEERALLEQACEQLRQAFTEGKAQTPPIRMMLGRVYLRLAWFPGDPAARRTLFEEACKYLEGAAKAAPSQDSPYSNWGSAVAGLAALSSGREQSRLLARAEELFTRQTRHAKRRSKSYLEAANAWLQVAAEPSVEVAREGARRAAEAARRANSIEPGSGDYTLACALSRLGEIAEAAEALIAALASEDASAAEALADPDFEPLWAARPELREKLAGG